MPWPIEIKDEKIILWERRGGTKGTNYFYILDPHRNKLFHVSRFFTSILEGTSRANRRKNYRNEASISMLKTVFGDNITLYMFWYSNSGYGPYISKYIVDVEKGKIEEEKTEKFEVLRYSFEISDAERQWVEYYEKYVPPMISEIKQMISKIGIKIFFAGHATRLEDLLDDPRLGLINALAQPTWQARQKALEAYIRGAHELYVLFHVVDSLNPKPIPKFPEDEKPYWWIEYASSSSTGIVETANGKRYTIWYQFSPKHWWEIVREGWFKAMFEKNIVQSSSGRQYVRPDIVIMEGEFRYRSDLNNKSPEKIMLIDAKISFTDKDFKQLEGYRRYFGKMYGTKINYIVACLEDIRPRYKEMLEEIGYYVIEWVSPGSKGVQQLRNLARKLLLQ